VRRRPDSRPGVHEMLINPQATYVHLGGSGVASEVPGGPAFWSLPAEEMLALGGEWLISEFEFTSDWPTWEMHPNGDEFVYLLSGSVELLLEGAAGVKSLSMLDSGAVIVPRGVWHTAKVHAPSRMLHVTLGAGTETRPAWAP
jgi:mannose-6-phosphate isomerase-like protein (cupin superfamily)